MRCSFAFLDYPASQPFQLFENFPKTWHLTATYIAGYMPGIGALAALIHSIGAVGLLHKGTTPKERKENKAIATVLFVRAAFEVVGIGILLAPLDIGCTLARQVRAYLNKKKAAEVV